MGGERRQLAGDRGRREGLTSICIGRPDRAPGSDEGGKLRLKRGSIKKGDEEDERCGRGKYGGEE